MLVMYLMIVGGLRCDVTRDGSKVKGGDRRSQAVPF